jgi:hypothetical protein
LGPSQSGAIAREKRTVQAMVEIYCADHHPPDGVLCPECRELLEYAHERLDRCPYREDKPTCRDCPVHCYRPDAREAIRDVMRYAGPRMLRRHPWLAVVHLWRERVRQNPGRPPRRETRS